jgi:beta-xylosidase
MMRMGGLRVLAGVAVMSFFVGGVAGCGSSPSAQYTNPVYTKDFPDPFVFKDGKTFYAYATNTEQGGNTPLLESTDLVHWKFKGEAFPITPRWLDRDIWAPTVARVAGGRYVEYYAAHDPTPNVQCIGVATARSPAGPFVDRSAKPKLCQRGGGGDIDPDLFRDTDGTLYLYFKNDGNCCGLLTYLWAQKLAPNGTTFVGKPVRLIYNDESWSGPVAEAPFMWERDGRYYLFYSGAAWDSVSYAVGYAACKGPMGPCKDAPENPIFQYHQGCRAAGPGGETLVRDSKGQDWMLYHAWNGTVGYDQGGVRALWMDPLNWKNGKPVPSSPTCKKEAAPAVS